VRQQAPGVRLSLKSTIFVRIFGQAADFWAASEFQQISTQILSLA
jgi:hypothetical protein